MNWSRWWPLTGILFAVGAFLALIISSDPDTNDPNQKIVAHFQDHSNRVNSYVSFFLMLGAVLFLVWFVALLRSRTTMGGRPGMLGALPFGAALVSGALWIVAFALFTAPALAISDTSKFKLDPDTYRILDDMGYGVWFSAVTVMALLVFAVGVFSLRTGFLPRWLAWLSFPVGITMLVAFFFIPFLIMLGWFLVVGITLIVRQPPRAEPGLPVT